jgi:glycosyl transferase family 2
VFVLAFLFLLALLFDAQNILSRWRRNVIDVGTDKSSDDYTLCITLYGDPSYFRNREWLARWRERVLVILSNMPEFATELRAEGWRVFEVTLDKPSPPAMIREALDAGMVTTKYAVRMDADVETRGDIDAAIGAMDAAGAEVCSVKTHVLNEDTSICTRMQAVEYRMSMLGRHNRPWCLSGAFFVVRTDLLRKIYHRHSCWFFGEDSETGIVARRLGMKIAHLDFEVLTEAPETWRAWVRQRRAWWAGSFRQTWVNFPHMTRYPLWMAYNVLLVWAMIYLRSTTIWQATEVLPVIMLIYIGLALVANWQVRSDWMVIFPFYALVQVAFLPLYGFFYYWRMAIWHRRAGFYQLPIVGRVNEEPGSGRELSGAAIAG